MNRTTTSIVGCIVLSVLMLSGSEVLSAQATFNIFPQFADGRFTDSTYYRSTLMILPWFEGDAPQCNFTLYGMSATFVGGINSSALAINLPSGGSAAVQTTGLQ